MAVGTAPGARATAGLRADPAAFAGAGKLAFISRGSLWLLDGATGGLRRIAAPAGYTAGSPTFSANGQWLAYVATGKHMTTPDGDNWVASAVMVANAGTGQEQRLSTVDGPTRSLIGWAPTGATLAFVTPASNLDQDPYLPPSRVELWTPKGTRLLASAPEVEGGAWSPDSASLAVVSDTDWPRTRSSWSASVTVYPLSGGAGATWARYVDTAHPDGDLTSRPNLGPKGDVAYLLPMGWWPKLGIGVAVVGGNPGSPFDSSLTNGGALPLALLTSPQAKVKVLGSTMVNGAVGAPTASLTGALAFTNNPSARPIWQSEDVEHCAAGVSPCTSVDQGASTVSMDAAWSPDGSQLAYVVGKKQDGAGFTQASVQNWYGSLRLEIYRPGKPSVQDLRSGAGAVVPTWSSNSQSLLFVKDDGIWLWRGLQGKPMRVEYPLLAPDDWGAYFGQVPWAQQFAWWSGP